MVAGTWTTVQLEIVVLVLLLACHKRQLKRVCAGPAFKLCKNKKIAIETQINETKQVSEWWRLVFGFVPHGVGRKE